MADAELIQRLKRGFREWNRWREEHPSVELDFRGADLRGTKLIRANLSGADLRGAELAGADLSWADLSDTKLGGADLTGAKASSADLSRADLRGSKLEGTDFMWANLREAKLRGTDLSRTVLSSAVLHSADLREANLASAFLHPIDLRNADLRKADLRGATLLKAKLFSADLRKVKAQGASFRGADLSSAKLDEAKLNGADLESADLAGTTLNGADLSRADLTCARVVQADFQETILDGARVYGVSAWSLKNLPTASQADLVITAVGEPDVEVDDLEVAQFVYLLLHNEKIRHVVDTITNLGVLVLGRFYEERKAVLDALRDRLRELGLVPIVFDWKKPTRRDLTETVQLLANMSRFVIADVTDAKSIPQELSHIIPFFPSVPVCPIILEGEYEYSMFEHWASFNSVLPVHRYRDGAHLIENIQEAIIRPVEAWEAGADKTRALRDENAALRDRIRELEELGGRPPAAGPTPAFDPRT